MTNDAIETRKAASKLKHLKSIAKLKRDHELRTVRPMLEDLVRAAYPRLAMRCLCSACLREELQRGADRG